MERIKMPFLMNEKKSDQQPPAKRQRILPATTGASTAGENTNFSLSSGLCRGTTDGGPIFTDVQEIVGCSSIESALGVPATILFRQIGGDRKEPENDSSKNLGQIEGKKESRRRLRPLLSRQEAEQFLRLTLLAQQIDSLVDLSETFLSRQQFARRFRRDVLMQGDMGAPESNNRPWKNPWLTTLGPILDVLLHQQRLRPSSKQSPFYKRATNQRQNSQEHILYHIHNELSRLYYELEACGVYEMERSAEQNRSLVASLTDILGYHNDDLPDNGQGGNHDDGRTSAVRKLAQEKHSLSKLQDLLAKRVRSLLLVLCYPRPTVTAESDNTTFDGNEIDIDFNKESEKHTTRKEIIFDENNSSTNMNQNNLNKGSCMNDIDNKNKFRVGDESSLLSLDEILRPLEFVCDELFSITNCNATGTRKGNIQNDSESVFDFKSDKSVNQKETSNAESTQKEKKQHIDLINGKYADPITMISTEASQRTVGAAVTMMALASKSAAHNCTDMQIRDNTNPSKKASIADRDPRLQQYTGKDDESFVDDPPFDDEEDEDETTSKWKEDISCKKNAMSNSGVFDVIDALTPQSQSNQ